MRTVPQWVNKIHEADKVEISSVHSTCFSPDGSQLVIGAGERVMVYNPSDGALIQLLQAHKGAVYAVAYSHQGTTFASGSADKNVIIWSNKMEGVLKYSHNDAVQCLAYNPVSTYLASCALTDFAFWSTEMKAVQKHKINGRITSCAWSPSGQTLAIGLAGGLVSLRDKNGEEKYRIKREAAVWAVAWSGATLLVTDWSNMLSFYDIMGQQINKEKSIGLSALSLSVMGDLILVAGIGGWAVLTSEGGPIVQTPYEWVWSIQPSAANNTLAVSCQDGTLWCYQMVFSTVHGLYRERYAYRENMTDVIIQHLGTGAKVRIKCHDRVQKIAIYKHRLAVQLPERVVVYEQGDGESMLYRVKEKLAQKMECSLLVATSDSLLLCQDTKLVMIGCSIPKSWIVPADIRYIKVLALNYKETLLLGLMNGQIWKVELDNPTASMMLNTPAAVRCLDLSASKERISVVDEKSICRVYEVTTGNLLFQEDNVSSVSWNCWCEELLCLSGGGILSIKAGIFPAASQPLNGSVVGFQGGRVFSLQGNVMQTVHVPLSHAMHQYIQRNMFREAYAVACLGVTAKDWESLGFAALEELCSEIARKAFQRSQNVAYIMLIDSIAEQLEAGEPRGAVLGEVLAYRGQLADAARAFRTAGCDKRALHMYTDLRMFNKAQEYLGAGESGAALVVARAEWARHVNEPRAAVDMFLAAGDVKQAAEIMRENGWIAMLIETSRKIDKGSTDGLEQIASALCSVGSAGAAVDVYLRLGETGLAAKAAVQAGDWTRAFALVGEHPQCRRDVYLPYATSMAAQDNFVEAQKAYHKSGEVDTAFRVFTVLVNNAICEERFADAGYLHHLLASQCLEMMREDQENTKRQVMRYNDNSHLSSIYYAYEMVHQSVREPFSLCQPEALFNAARFVLSQVSGTDPPKGVSMFCVYLCMAEQAKRLGGHTVAKQMLKKILTLQIPAKFQAKRLGGHTVDKQMLKKILTLQIPAKFQESVELAYLRSAGESGGDTEELSPLCWRCRRHITLTAAHCPHCQHKLLHSNCSFEILPLVQFVPDEDISPEEALQLINAVPFINTKPKEKLLENGAQVMEICQNGEGDEDDPFITKMEQQMESAVLSCGRDELLNLDPVSAVVISRVPPLPPLFYRNMLPDMPITACKHCYKTFYMEDFEMQQIVKGHCPVCRQSDRKADDDGDMSGFYNNVDPNAISSPSPPTSPQHSKYLV